MLPLLPQTWLAKTLALSVLVLALAHQAFVWCGGHPGESATHLEAWHAGQTCQAHDHDHCPAEAQSSADDDCQDTAKHHEAVCDQQHDASDNGGNHSDHPGCDDQPIKVLQTRQEQDGLCILPDLSPLANGLLPQEASHPEPVPATAWLDSRFPPPLSSAPAALVPAHVQLNV